MATKIITEIYKRVPPNQMKQFYEFRDKSDEYKQRVMKIPDPLPKIDFDYYRLNVRKDYVKMVDEFEKKYKETKQIFDDRHKMDTSAVYVEWQRIRDEVEEDVKKYKAESNERIKYFQCEIERIKNLVPYAEMTCEEFCDLLPQKSMFKTPEGRDSFWPHLPEDQYIGPAGGPKYLHHHDDGASSGPVTAKVVAGGDAKKDSKIIAKAATKDEKKTGDKPKDAKK